MLQQSIALSLLAGLVVAQDPAPKPDQLWLQDFAKAKARAKTENKDLLVDFTGSDWCHWCIKLDEEVFAKPEFRRKAPESFVLVKLDFPRDKTLVTPAIQAQNAKLQALYPVPGFPTILLMDPDGRVFAQTGYQPGGPTAYNEMLAGLKKKGSAFKAALQVAAGRQGIERATALEDALGTLDEPIAQTFHFELMREIVALDADGKGGLKDKYEARVKRMAVERQLSAAGQELQDLIGAHMEKQEHDQALAKLQAVIKAPKNKLHHQMALFFQGMVLMEKQDVQNAITALEAALAVMPDSPVAARINQVLPQIKQQDGGK